MKSAAQIVKDNSIEASYQVQDQILTNVAHKMWEKDLSQKFEKKYTTTWSKQYAPHLLQGKYDPRKDDNLLTPKNQETVSDKK